MSLSSLQSAAALGLTALAGSHLDLSEATLPVASPTPISTSVPKEDPAFAALSLGVREAADAALGAPTAPVEDKDFTPRIRGHKSLSVKDGVLRLDNKHFFPIGIYHDAQDLEQVRIRNGNLKWISQAGFNVINTSLGVAHEPFVDACAEEGIFLFARPADQDKKQLMREMKSWKPVLAVSLSEYLDSKRAENDPEAVREQADAIKKWSKKDRAYGRVTSSSRYQEFIGALELTAVQIRADDIMSSPFFHTRKVGEGKSGGELKKEVLGVHDHGHALLPTIEIAQDGNPVTPEQLRSMTYQAVLAGANGVFYDAYLGEGKDLSKYPSVRDEMQLCVKELHHLSPALLHQERKLHPDDAVYFYDKKSDEAVLYGIWADKREMTVIVINTTDDTQSLTLPLEVRKADLSPVFSERPNHQYTFEDGHLIGKLDAGQAVVLQGKYSQR